MLFNKLFIIVFYYKNKLVMLGQCSSVMELHCF